MTRKEFETLKDGNIVSPVAGANKGQLVSVTSIICGYIYADFIDPSLSNKNEKHMHADFFASYRKFKRITAFDMPPVNEETTKIIDALCQNGGETYEQ